MERSHRITTPEHTVVEYDLAGIGSRAVALLVDYAAIGLVSAAVGAGVAALAQRVPHGLSGLLTQSSPLAYLIGLYLLSEFLFIQFYFVLFELFWNGRTPGKRLLSLRVLSASGRPVNFFSSFIRNLLRWVDILPSGYLVGLVFILSTRKEQRLGDLAAGTVVVFDRGFHERSRSAGRRRRKSPRGTEPAGPVPETALRTAKLLSGRDLDAVQAFARREHQFSEARREQLAASIARAIVRAIPEDLPDLVEWARSIPARELVSQCAAAAAAEDPPAQERGERPPV